VVLEVGSSRATNSISRQQLLEKGFSLRVENNSYKIKGFAVVLPCQSDWLMDVMILKFIGSVAPSNHKGLRLLRVGDILDINSVTLEKGGRCYWTSGMHLSITE